MDNAVGVSDPGPSVVGDLLDRTTRSLTALGLPELVVTGRPPDGAAMLNALAPRIGQARPGTQLRWRGIALEVVDVPHP